MRERIVPAWNRLVAKLWPQPPGVDDQDHEVLVIPVERIRHRRHLRRSRGVYEALLDEGHAARRRRVLTVPPRLLPVSGRRDVIDQRHSDHSRRLQISRVKDRGEASRNSTSALTEGCWSVTAEASSAASGTPVASAA